MRVLSNFSLFLIMLKCLLTLLSLGWIGSSSVAGNFICEFPIVPVCPPAFRQIHVVYQWAALPSSSQGEPCTKKKGRWEYLLPRLPLCWVASGRLVPPPKSPVKVTFPAGFSLLRFWVITAPLLLTAFACANSPFANNPHPIIFIWLWHLFAGETLTNSPCLPPFTQ